METKDGAGSQNGQDDISECRASAMGDQNFAECLCEGPNACQYALPFGYAFLCQHPRVKEIVANTKKSMQTVTNG
jgi:hypothetical protein